MLGTSKPGTAGSSGWAPFRHPTFAPLRAATVLLNIGSWLQHDLGAGWLMCFWRPPCSLRAYTKNFSRIGRTDPVLDVTRPEILDGQQPTRKDKQ